MNVTRCLSVDVVLLTSDLVSIDGQTDLMKSLYIRHPPEGDKGKPCG